MPGEKALYIYAEAAEQSIIWHEMRKFFELRISEITSASF